MRRGEYISRHIRSHLFVYFFVLGVLIIGISSGTLAENMLSARQILELQQYLGAFMKQLSSNSLEPVTLLEVLSGHLKLTIVVWLAGTFVIGIPIIVACIFFKGFTLGFSMGFLLQEMGWRGIVFALASLIPQNLIAIPAYVMLFVVTVDHALMSITNKNYRRRRRVGKHYTFASYTLLCLILTAGLLVASFVETFITPLLMRLVVSLI